MNKAVIWFVTHVPPWTVFVLIIGLAVATTFFTIQNAEELRARVYHYADIHHGRVESYNAVIGSNEHGDITMTKWRVYLPDGSFVSQDEMARQGWK